MHSARRSSSSFERFFSGWDVAGGSSAASKLRALATIPGGGGEIFAPRVRRRIGIGKCTGDDWLRVMRVAHEEGMNTSCTMLIGHIEFVRERIEHMGALRDMQDYAQAIEASIDEDAEFRWQSAGRADVDATIYGIRNRWPSVFARSAFKH